MRTCRRSTTLLALLGALTLTGCRGAAVDLPELVLTPFPTTLSCTAGDTVVVALSVSGAVSPRSLSLKSMNVTSRA
jgi:hypothetical protein